MKIILATRNPSKTEQIKAIFDNPIIEIVTLQEAGINGEAVEDGETLKENALKKARFARKNSDGNIWVMADDTGLFVKALGGEPGVQAAYWGGAEKTTEERMQYALDRLSGFKDRSATFETVVGIISPDGEEHFFSGICTGSLVENPKVAPQPKMPYSALFVPDGFDHAWAEITTKEENSISHRGRAFRKAKEFLEKNI